MANPIVYYNFVRKKYVSPWFSWATLFQLVMIIILLVAPIIIAWLTSGFNLQSVSHFEQPKLKLLNGTTILLEGNSLSNPIFYTSVLYGSSYFRDSTIQETNVETDGQVTGYEYTIKVPLQAGESINRFSLLLFYEASISRVFPYENTLMAFIQASTPINSEQLYFQGDLTFHQLGDFKDNMTKVYPPSYVTDDLRPILKQYLTSNINLQAANSWTWWGTASDGYFTATVYLNIAHSQIYYTPGIGQVLRMGWVQWVSLFWIAFFFITIISDYVFRNQLIETKVINESLVDPRDPRTKFKPF